VCGEHVRTWIHVHFEFQKGLSPTISTMVPWYHGQLKQKGVEYSHWLNKFRVGLGPSATITKKIKLIILFGGPRGTTSYMALEGLELQVG